MVHREVLNVPSHVPRGTRRLPRLTAHLPFIVAMRTHDTHLLWLGHPSHLIDGSTGVAPFHMWGPTRPPLLPLIRQLLAPKPSASLLERIRHSALAPLFGRLR